MTDDDLTEKIIACAFKVHKALGPGFSEKVYENAMRVELTRQRIKVRNQVAIQVYYEGEVVGEFVPDLWAEDRVLVESKAVLALQKDHEVQLVNYLTATKYRYWPPDQFRSLRRNQTQIPNLQAKSSRNNLNCSIE
jgi:GxxExxY protein